MQLDHITIRTRNLPATRGFFLRVFYHLEERPRPRAIRRIPGHWLFVGNDPVVHLIGSQGYGVDDAAEAWDHIGFRLQGYAAFRAWLDRLGIRYSPMDLPELSERRLFFAPPAARSSKPFFVNFQMRNRPMQFDQNTRTIVIGGGALIN